MGATVAGTEAAVPWLLEVSEPARSFLELGRWGSKGATGSRVWRAALVPAAGGSSLEYG